MHGAVLDLLKSLYMKRPRATAGADPPIFFRRGECVRESERDRGGDAGGGISPVSFGSQLLDLHSSAPLSL